VGNATQPFSRLLDEVTRLALQLPQPVVVQHGGTPFQTDLCEAIPFVEMREFERLVAGAELLILHAGAGSVIHAVRAGKVPVVMPRRLKYDEHVDDHQVEFAAALEAAGRVAVAYEPAQLEDAVRRALEMQRSAGMSKDESLMVRLVGETLAGYARRYS
jgi:UDP-N-acetylglucosamine transferase subunit ALG13